MNTVADILRVKGHRVYCIDHNASAYEAVARMVAFGVGSLVVTNDEGPCGIVSERQYLERIVMEGRDPHVVRVRQIMRTGVRCVEPGTSTDECMGIMTRDRTRQLPVIDEGRLDGIVSIGDVVKHLAEERRSEVRSLTDYIQGRYPG